MNQPPSVEVVAARVAGIRRHVTELTSRRVAIVGVTKTFAAEAWLIARDAGCEAVGENYAEEILAKHEALVSRGIDESELPPVHFIGHLQSNKVRQLYPLIAVWQTVDRVSLVSALAREQDRHGRQAAILVQVNATGEEQKSGCTPEALEALVGEARTAGLAVRGLMTVGPTSGDADETRRAFRIVAGMAQSLGLDEVSMGMSGDMDIGLDEGSTMLRIGTALFGQRPHYD